ncbi:phosphoesterase [Fictibacillus macauensis ZFHKF-1]|uniref:Phosphoesterase n=1 Tax=Fictibacillus macauensis ZFHKF-1 TaxID=1196324 RepID=I8J3B2_9BACL|nr:metallophosphoesterase [Fictibacillus macauensis]EIT86251.1 phosphoesterase [Fictibacillus macauensis ZFHKF-1]
MKRYSRFVFILVIYNLLLLYIGYNGWIWSTQWWPSLSPFLYSVVFLIFAYAYLLGGRNGPMLLKILGSYWFAFLEYSLLVLPVANIIGGIALLYYDKHAVILWTGIAALLAFLVIFIVGTRNAYSPVVRRYDVRIPKSGGKQSKLTMAVASDMHFGLLSGRAHAGRLVSLLQREQPDLILYPGDIIDDTTKHFVRKDMHTLLAQATAPLGVYGILGNHEYYGGEIDAYTQLMEEIGIPILRDEVRLIDDSFYIIGRNDYTDKKRQSIEALVSSLDHGKPLILLDHQPHALEEAMKNGIDLSLSGHTHRGQMAPNQLVTRRMFELDWGYKQKQQLHAFVSSGFGFWGPPIRIGSRSELLVITVTFIS